MGILSKVTKVVSNLGGGHAIDRNKVLGQTSPGAVNPSNPGNWSTVRTTPVLHEPGYVTQEQSDLIREITKEKVKGARLSVKAMQNLGKIEVADAEVHKAHKKYLGVAADAELTKVRSNARLARKLHGQRPAYAGLDQGLQNAEQLAQQRIAELKQRIQQSY